MTHTVSNFNDLYFNLPFVPLLSSFHVQDYAIGSPSSNNNTITPNKNKTLNRSSPSILKSSSLFNPTNGFDSPNLKHVTVDVHHHNHVNQEPSTSGRGVILPGLESMYIGTKSPSEDSGVDVHLTNGLHSLANIERWVSLSFNWVFFIICINRFVINKLSVSFAHYISQNQSFWLLYDILYFTHMILLYALTLFYVFLIGQMKMIIMI